MLFSFQVAFHLAAARIVESERKEVWRLAGTPLEDVVPVVLGGTEAAKRGVETHHLCGDGVTGSVGVKTAIDGQASG